MIKINFKAIFLISILIGSFLSISDISGANLNVYSRTQGNCGDGVISIYATDPVSQSQCNYNYRDHLINKTYIKCGDIQCIELTTNVKTIHFDSVGRHDMYDGTLSDIMDFIIATNGSKDINVDVNFYKKRC